MLMKQTRSDNDASGLDLSEILGHSGTFCTFCIILGQLGRVWSIYTVFLVISDHFSPWLIEKNALRIDPRTDGATDGRTHGRMDGRIDPFIEMRGRIYKMPGPIHGHRCRARFFPLKKK